MFVPVVTLTRRGSSKFVFVKDTGVVLTNSLLLATAGSIAWLLVGRGGRGGGCWFWDFGKVPTRFDFSVGICTRAGEEGWNHSRRYLMRSKKHVKPV